MATIDLDNSYYGRRWQILINLADGTQLDVSDSDFGDYALRSTFTVDKPGYQAMHFAEISLWNLNAETDNQIYDGAKGTVIINAGYVSGAYGKIFEGKIFQVIREREDNLNFKLTLNCVDNMLEPRLAAFTLDAGTNAQSAIYNLANNATSKITLGQITDNLSSSTLPRGRVYFGDPKKFLKQIAISNDAQFYVNDDAVHITKISDNTTTSITVSPDTGLIGFPQQIDYGITCTVLLNPNFTIVNPAMFIKLDQSAIRQQLLKVGYTPTKLEKDGEYKVARIMHRGDTKGNEWYTEITGITKQGTIPYNMIN